MISDEVLNEAKRRLVDGFHSDKIILFGSQARSTTDDRSDVAQWPLTLRDAEQLTDYAVATRYPSEAAEVTAQDAHRAIENTEQVRRQVIAVLHELGVESI